MVLSLDFTSSSYFRSFEKPYFESIAMTDLMEERTQNAVEKGGNCIIRNKVV